jgi:hypothetical protein
MNYYFRVITAFILTMQAVEAAMLQIDPQVSTVEISDMLTLDIIGTDQTVGSLWRVDSDPPLVGATHQDG